VNTTELDIKKGCRNQSSSTSLGSLGRRAASSTPAFGGAQPSAIRRLNSQRSADELQKDIELLRQRLDRRITKVSKVADA
jgi:hypothetical protein